MFGERKEFDVTAAANNEPEFKMTMAPPPDVGEDNRPKSEVATSVSVSTIDLVEESSDTSRVKMLKLCEQRWCARLVRGLSLSLLLGAAWLLLVAEAGAAALPPGGPLYALVLLLAASQLAALAVACLRLPPLLGSLFAGLLLRNVGAVQPQGLYTLIAAIVRKAALTVIMMRAGLGLEAGALRRLSGVVARLALLPSITEAGTLAVATYYLLSLPWLWGLLLGAAMAAVSPAVVIPCLFALQERGYGTKKGIPTLVVAAASVDDIFAVSIFGIMINVIFSEGNLTMKIIEGPLGIIIGLAFGIVWGVILYFFPKPEDRFCVSLRTWLLLAGGLVCVLGSEAVGYNGAGPLGATVAGFVAAAGWRRQGWPQTSPVSQSFKTIWAFFQPALFGLIGAEINLFELEGDRVGLAIACLAIALTCRILISVVIAFGAGFNVKEKTFLAFAWLPKATVQAALGPVALDIVRSMVQPDSDQLLWARTVLEVAVLAILLTAPIGSALIMLLGPRLLPLDAQRPV
ncbi:putative SLC9B1-like protein SLC9B1P1 [Schistocerca piceifrons]|uniref:putative SLC9B1-like protein SLC9B1P1 n=1 Tax=Schistocerca piceifrons TaxID=274613 RepID=UPI001F5F353B|nr:putative SLC9B1-like protein SLC9B1P1 [Schistocerca piceifrons]